MLIFLDMLSWWKFSSFSHRFAHISFPSEYLISTWTKYVFYFIQVGSEIGRYI